MALHSIPPSVLQVPNASCFVHSAQELEEFEQWWLRCSPNTELLVPGNLGKPPPSTAHLQSSQVEVVSLYLLISIIEYLALDLQAVPSLQTQVEDFEFFLR